MKKRKSEKRRFGSRQRVALFLAARGTCGQCNDQLGPAWHADHVVAYSRDGATDTVNGQALCPPCNLRKGARHPENPAQRTDSERTSDVAESAAKSNDD